MSVIAQVFVVIAGLFHVAVFAMESLLFRRPSTYRRFLVKDSEVDAARPWAFNQGFYNLFLAVGTAIGIAIEHSDRDAGIALVVFGVGSMLAAATVLIASDPGKARGALVQGTFPAISLLLLALWAWA